MPNSDESVLRLGADVGISRVAALKGDFEQCLAAGHSLACIASDIERADLASVQLLISAQRSFRERGLSFRLAGASPTLRRAFSRAGIATDDGALFSEGH